MIKEFKPNTLIRSIPHFRWCLGFSLMAASPSLLAATANNSAIQEAETLPAMVVSDSQIKDDREVAADGYVARNSSAGTKTNTAISEVPQSISVVTHQQIEDQAPARSIDALRYSPGIAPEVYGGGTRSDTYTSSRGMGLDLYLDDLAAPHGQNYAGWMTDPYLLERVEYLRGPASVLYGQGSPGGTVNYVTKQPSFENIRQLRVEYGTDAWRKVEVDLAGAVNDRDDLAYRLVMTGLDAHQTMDPLDNQRYTFAPSLTWLPNDATKITLMGGIYHEDSSNNVSFLPAQGTVLPNPNGKIDYDLFVSNPDFEMYKKHEKWLGYRIEHDINDTWQFRQNFRYANLRTNVKNVYGGVGWAGNSDSNIMRVAAHTQPDYTRYSLDNQLQGQIDTGNFKHTLLLGVNYERAENDSPMRYGYASFLDLYNPVHLPTESNMLTPFYLSDTTNELRQLGVYAQDQIKMGQHWAVTLGGRYDRAATEQTNHLTSIKSNQTDSAFTGRAGLVYLTDFGLNPYISYSESFSPQLGSDVNGKAFEPSEGKQTELGLKYSPQDSNLELTAALFDLRRTNIPETDTLNPAFDRLIGEIHSQGVELGAKGEVLPNLILQAAYTYQEVTKSKSFAGDTTLDKQRSATPRQFGSIWSKYAFKRGNLAGLDLGVGVRYVGESEGNNENDFNVPDFTLLDAAISYQVSPDLKLSLNATNLTDKKYISACSDENSCFPGPRRRVLGSVTYNW